jgi:hypothetical protein
LEPPPKRKNKDANMYIPTTESNRKCCDQNSERSSNNADRAARIIAKRFALSRNHAREVAALAGLGGEARS